MRLKTKLARPVRKAKQQYDEIAKPNIPMDGAWDIEELNLVQEEQGRLTARLRSSGIRWYHFPCSGPVDGRSSGISSSRLNWSIPGGSVHEAIPDVTMKAALGPTCDSYFFPRVTIPGNNFK